MIIPVDFAQVNFIHGGVAYPLGAQWTLGLKVDAFVGSAFDIAVACETAFDDNLQDLQVASCALDSIHVKLGPNSTGATADLAVGTNGTIVQDPAVPATAILVRKNTALGGRHGRGRTYFPGGADATFLSGGAMSALDIAAVNAGFLGFHNDLIAADLIPTLLHADATTPVPITSWSCQAVGATQRRRMRR